MAPLTYEHFARIVEHYCNVSGCNVVLADAPDSAHLVRSPEGPWMGFGACCICIIRISELLHFVWCAAVGLEMNGEAHFQEVQGVMVTVAALYRCALRNERKLWYSLFVSECTAWNRAPCIISWSLCLLWDHCCHKLPHAISQLLCVPGQNRSSESEVPSWHSFVCAVGWLPRQPQIMLRSVFQTQPLLKTWGQAGE